jgi:hypothetical protein
LYSFSARFWLSAFPGNFGLNSLFSAKLQTRNRKTERKQCKTPQMYAGYLGRIGQDVLPKREGLIEWKLQPTKQKDPR